MAGLINEQSDFRDCREKVKETNIIWAYSIYIHNHIFNHIYNHICIVIYTIYLQYIYIYSIYIYIYSVYIYIYDSITLVYGQQVTYQRMKPSFINLAKDSVVVPPAPPNHSLSTRKDRWKKKWERWRNERDQMRWEGLIKWHVDAPKWKR